MLSIDKKPNMNWAKEMQLGRYNARNYTSEICLKLAEMYLGT